MEGNAKVKRQSWIRGNGNYSLRGELKHGIKIRKKELNRKVRHDGKNLYDRGEYRKIVKSCRIVDFT